MPKGKNMNPSLKKVLRNLTLMTIVAGLSQFAVADEEYAAAWGPAIGARAPLLDAQDHNGSQQTLDSLSGENGVLVVFNRSVDW